MTGEDPAEIDHIDGDRANNQWANLRNVDRATNAKNRSLSRRRKRGYDLPMGITRLDNQFEVRVSGKYIGAFYTIEEARAARLAAEVLLGFHPNHGRPPGKHKI